jgi:hypothetical protein
VSVDAPNVTVLSSANPVAVEKDLGSGGIPADVLGIDLQVLQVGAVGPDCEPPSPRTQETGRPLGD